VIGWLRRWADRIGGRTVPPGFAGALDAEEHVIAVAEVRDGGHLVATSYGLWSPAGERIGWHLISKAVWRNGALTVVTAEEFGAAGQAILLRDRPPVRFDLAEPGKVPETVHRRVTSSIRSTQHRELPTGGAWFVQRKVPGRDGIVLQVRPDDDTDLDVVQRVAAEVAATLRTAQQIDPA
jgi:hypothetical protein